MVTTHDYSSDTEKPESQQQYLRKHNRSSSSDQAKKPQVDKSLMEQDLPPASPSSKLSSKNSERPQGKRRKSSASSSSKNKSSNRPSYSRKYSTPPSRPVSPSGFPQVLEPDMVIPQIDLNHHFRQSQQTFQAFRPVVQYQQEIPLLQVDSAPQEPDLWSDPETDYFSSIEGAVGVKHARGKSRRQISQSLNGTHNAASLNALLAAGGGTSQGLQQISEDAEVEFHGLRIPGGFSV